MKAGNGAGKKSAKVNKWPYLYQPVNMAALALQFQFDEIERWPLERIAEQQMRQAGSLIRHAVAQSPHYREHLSAWSELPESGLSPEDWRSLPILTRRQLQDAGADIFSAKLPPGHKVTSEVTTSGSTGSPVTVRSTPRTAIFARALGFRAHRWHGRDPRGRFANVRTDFDDKEGEERAWSWLPDGGPSIGLKLNQPIGDLFDRLIEAGPHYVQTRPSVLAELARLSRDRGQKPEHLRDVIAFGECLRPQDRDAVTENWQVRVYDNYSAMEVGTIAHECAEGGQLHVQAESLLCEILDDDGRACAPGEVGRVVVTALHNFATPLIRYAIGDYARAGETCACGRSLPVLAQVMGRYKSLLLLPDGARHFPNVIPYIAKMTPFRQCQIRQTDPDRLRLTLEIDRPLEEREANEMTNFIRERFDYPLRVDFEIVDKIERRPGEKYQEFISDVAPEDD